MEEIRIYHSIWKNAAVIAVCFVFVGLGMLCLLDGKNTFKLWISILFFVLGGMFVAFLLFRQRLFNKPFYIITDKYIYVDTGLKKWEVKFSDVEEFYLRKLKTSEMIVIRYKKDIEVKKMKESSGLDRTFRKINEKMIGSQEALIADDLTMSPEQLCELFNLRLKQQIPL